MEGGDGSFGDIFITQTSKANYCQDKTAHLRFKRAQPKMCHSPKIEEKIKTNFKLLRTIF